AWEPRWLLPGETIVADEEPDADFVFVLVHGSCVVLLEDREIENVGQGETDETREMREMREMRQKRNGPKRNKITR
ncbi:Uncharacterized protein SCF082_LOCUS31947, partial [Durusdinium trenchii]